MPDCLLRQWLQLLRESSTLDAIPPGVAKPVQKAYERLDFSKWGTPLVQNYEEDELNLNEYTGVMTRKYEEGREEGKKERETDIARNLLSQNIPIDVISDATGLSKGEIEALKALGI